VSGNLAAGTLFPTGDTVSVTINGVTQTATVDASGNFSAAFSTGTLGKGPYAITYAFAGDSANFAAAANGSGTLTVGTVPQVTTNPQSQTVTAGTKVSFTLAATGSPRPTVQWQYGRDGGTTWTNIAGATGATLSFTATSGENGYQIRAVLTNALGTANTTAATLTVQYPPAVTTNPQSQTVTAGTKVTFTARARGNPTPTVQWQYSTDGGSTWIDIVGATGTSLSFTAQASENGYLFQAVFTNLLGTGTTTAATLTV
jgi:hypothetical protein